MRNTIRDAGLLWMGMAISSAIDQQHPDAAILLALALACLAVSAYLKSREARRVDH